MSYSIPTLPLTVELETKPILKKLAKAHQALAELKGVSGIIPNQSILISTLSLQEAKDSSAIENIITTHDELYKSDVSAKQFANFAAKEVYSYAAALQNGYQKVKKTGLLVNNQTRLIQDMRDLMQSYKHTMREELPKIYSQDLLNNLFRHPYTKIDFVMKELQVTRITAMKYLEELVRIGLLSKHKKWKENYYINNALFDLLLSVGSKPGSPHE